MKIHVRYRCQSTELRGGPQADPAPVLGQGMPPSLLNAAAKVPLGIASLEPHHLNFMAIISLTFTNS